MATVNEQIVTGRKFRKLVDEATKLWQRISFWTKASDVEFEDGMTAETKVGAIKGITTDLNTTETGYAADMTALTELKTQLNSDISVRYDLESDYIQVKLGTVWENVVKANTQNLILYDNGTGLSASDFLVNNYIIPIENRYPTTPTLKINTDSISIYVTGSSSGVGYYCGSVFLKEKIDVSNFSKLKVTYKLAASYGNNWSNIGLTNEIASNYTPIKNAGMNPSSAGGLNAIAVAEMDISDISGKYYLAFLAATPYISNNSQNATTYIYRIELLK